MSIEKVSSRLTVDESASLAENVTTSIQMNEVEDAFVAEKHTLVKNLASDFVYAIRQSKIQAHTRLLFDLDQTRDDLFGAFKYFIKAYRKWNDGNKQVMAGRLWTVIAEHGVRIEKLSYNKQSALTNSILAELEKGENIEAINELNLTEIVAQLKASQLTFATTFGEARDTEAQKEEIQSATSLKKLLKKELDLLGNYLEMMLISKGDSYKPLYNNIKVHIAEANNSVN